MNTKPLVTLIFVIFSCAFGFAQSTDIKTIEKQAEALAEAQLVAYNNRDIEAFLEPYSDSVKIYNFPNDFRYQGKENMRQGYTSFFERAKDLHCELVSRTVFGNKVIDQEKVTGFSNNKDDVLYAIAIYTIENGKISEVHFINK